MRETLKYQWFPHCKHLSDLTLRARVPYNKYFAFSKITVNT